jgi:integrase/recombinase XerC
LPFVPSVEEMEAMIESVGDENSSWIARDKAMLEVLYGCGLSNGELTVLNLADINWHQLTILVLDPSGSQRIMPVGDPTAEALRCYIEERSAMFAAQRVELGSGPQPLFVNMLPRAFNTRGGNRRITGGNVCRIVKTIAKSAGLSSELHPHSLRYAYGVYMLDNGAELEKVQCLMGSQSPFLADILTRLTTADVEEAIDQTHPRGKQSPDRESPDVGPSIDGKGQGSAD